MKNPIRSYIQSFVTILTFVLMELFDNRELFAIEAALLLIIGSYGLKIVNKKNE